MNAQSQFVAACSGHADMILLVSRQLATGDRRDGKVIPVNISKQFYLKGCVARAGTRS